MWRKYQIVETCNTTQRGKRDTWETPRQTRSSTSDKITISRLLPLSEGVWIRNEWCLVEMLSPDRWTNKMNVHHKMRNKLTFCSLLSICPCNDCILSWERWDKRIRRSTTEMTRILWKCGRTIHHTHIAQTRVVTIVKLDHLRWNKMNWGDLPKASFSANHKFSSQHCILSSTNSGFCSSHSRTCPQRHRLVFSQKPNVALSYKTRTFQSQAGINTRSSRSKIKTRSNSD